jgi:hypothetical protein
MAGYVVYVYTLSTNKKKNPILIVLFCRSRHRKESLLRRADSCGLFISRNLDKILSIFLGDNLHRKRTAKNAGES